MNKYNELATCSKCGYCGQNAIHTQYEDGVDTPFRGDTLTRECQRCGYWWSELPLDKNGEAPDGN